MKNIKIIEHTADLGLEVKGKNYREVFYFAANAIISFALKQKFLNLPNKKRNIKIKADNTEELLHSFLNEIIFFIYTKKFYIKRIKIKKLTQKFIDVEIVYFYLKNISDYILRELKNVTYYKLKIIKQKNFYIANIIIDI